jgi:hypothetical protein
MPSAAALVSVFGPLLEIGARVLLVMACGLLVLAAVRMSGLAIRERGAGAFIAGWALGIVGVCAARIGFASLAFYGSPAMARGLPDPLSGAEIWRFLRSREAPIALAVGPGLLIALWLHRCREAGATAASSREACSRRIGAAGEVRVAGELKRIGLPALHNVILWRAAWSVELDHVVRVPSGIVVRNDRPRTRRAGLDTAHGRRCRGRQVGQSGAAEPGACAGGRRFSGRSAGADMRLRRLGRPRSVCTGDRGRGRSRRGFVMGAVDFFAEPNPRVLDAAWRRLEREAAKSASRRAAHEEYARRRREAFRRRRQAESPVRRVFLRAPRGASAAWRSRAACDRRRAPAITLVLTRVSA